MLELARRAGEGKVLLHSRQKMGPVLHVELGRQVASALTIVEADVPQPIQNKSLSQKVKGRALRGLPLGWQ